MGSTRTHGLGRGGGNERMLTGRLFSFADDIGTTIGIHFPTDCR